jgi:hypothetical protein
VAPTTQLGLLGAGVGKAEYTVIAGTFWQNTVLLGEPLVDPEARLRTLCHVVPGEWMLEGIGFYCGMSMRWFRDAFCDGEVALARARGVDPYAVMEEAAAKAPPGGVIAIMSNLMNAKRWVHASPSFLQFNLGDPAAGGRGACVRAIEEAAAFVARGHRDIIGELTGLRFGELVFTGGAAKGRLWPQIMADVLAVPVHVPVVTESSGLGAALCAGVGAGIYASFGELPASLRARSATFEPDPVAAAGYDERYPAWRTIYSRMWRCPRRACSTRSGGPPARSGRPQRRQRRDSARCIVMTEPKSGSGARLSRAARSVRNRAGQLVTILATAGSGTQSISAVTSGPAACSSAATMPATVMVRAGRVIAVRPPQAPSDDVAAQSSPSMARGGDMSATSVAASTGQTARWPASGSRMMPERKPDAAALGRPGRTQTVISRTARPRRKPFRV